MNELILWYGLPGSGKSTQLRKLEEAGIRIFDDFMQHSFRRRTGLRSSSYCNAILKCLASSEPCAISDIQLCHEAFRIEISDALAVLAPPLSMQWHCFDCRTAEAVAICQDNIRYRSAQTPWAANHSLDWIAQHASAFSIEPGARIHGVVQVRPDVYHPPMAGRAPVATGLLQRATDSPDA